jgi:hypothetical protein
VTDVCEEAKGKEYRGSHVVTLPPGLAEERRSSIIHVIIVAVVICPVGRVLFVLLSERRRIRKCKTRPGNCCEGNGGSEVKVYIFKRFILSSIIVDVRRWGVDRSIGTVRCG